MKALSVKSPHAQRIALGQKTMEIRSRRTHYRGDVLICVSKGIETQRPRDEETKWGGYQPPAPSPQPPIPDFRGMALCIVEIWDCRQMLPGDEADACHPFVPGAFVWKLRNVRAIRPFSVKGKLGFFHVDDQLIVERRSGSTNPQPPTTNPQFSRTIEDRLSRPTVGVPPLPDLCESRSSFALQGLHS